MLWLLYRQTILFHLGARYDVLRGFTLQSLAQGYLQVCGLTFALKYRAPGMQRVQFLARCGSYAGKNRSEAKPDAARPAPKK